MFVVTRRLVIYQRTTYRNRSLGVASRLLFSLQPLTETRDIIIKRLVDQLNEKDEALQVREPNLFHEGGSRVLGGSA